MQRHLDIYINRNNRTWFEQLESIANIDGERFSVKIGQAIEHFIRCTNGTPSLILDRKNWDGIIKKSSREELLEYNRLLNEMNNKIMGCLVRR